MKVPLLSWVDYVALAAVASAGCWLEHQKDTVHSDLFIEEFLGTPSALPHTPHTPHTPQSLRGLDCLADIVNFAMFPGNLTILASQRQPGLLSFPASFMSQIASDLSFPGLFA